jgi:hypothetical protein
MGRMEWKIEGLREKRDDRPLLHHDVLRLSLSADFPSAMTHDRNPRTLLDLAHERIAPTRDDQIDVSVPGRATRSLRHASRWSV